MLEIDGNILAMIQVFSSEKNNIGEDIKNWNDKIHVEGYMDLITGDTFKHYKSELEESSHIFIMNYSSKIYELLKNNRCRFLIDSLTYDVKFCDDPMFLHEHLEIYLKLS